MVDNDLNEQLQMLYARVDRIDDDLIAHYAGISEIVTGLSTAVSVGGFSPEARPLAAAIKLALVKPLVTYNFSSVGQRLVKKLLALIPGYDTFKKLQHIEAAGLVENLATNLANNAVDIGVTMAESLVVAQAAQALAATAQTTASTNNATAVANQTAAETALNIAIGTALTTPISDLIVAKTIADDKVASSTADLVAANQALTAANNNLLVLQANKVVNDANLAAAIAAVPQVPATIAALTVISADNATAITAAQATQAAATTTQTNAAAVQATTLAIQTTATNNLYAAIPLSPTQATLTNLWNNKLAADQDVADSTAQMDSANSNAANAVTTLAVMISAASLITRFIGTMDEVSKGTTKSAVFHVEDRR